MSKAELLYLERQGEKLPRTPDNVYNTGLNILSVAEVYMGQGKLDKAKKEYERAENFLKEVLAFGGPKAGKAALDLAYMSIEYHKYYKDDTSFQNYDRAKLYILIGKKLGNQHCKRLYDNKTKVFEGPNYSFDLSKYLQYLIHSPYSTAEKNIAKKYAEASIKNKKKYADHQETKESLKSAMERFYASDQYHNIEIPTHYDNNCDAIELAGNNSKCIIL